MTARHSEYLKGMGYRNCEHISPEVAVRHRCPCTNKEVCGAEEELVLKLAAQGKMASNYVLHETETATAAAWRLRGARRATLGQG